MDKLIIRNEKHSDIDKITCITETAFKNHEISDNTEQFIIKRLREVKALTVSLVAEIIGKVIGHIAFSPVEVSGCTDNWYGLGPVSVLPEYQKKGVGKALVNEACQY